MERYIYNPFVIWLYISLSINSTVIIKLYKLFAHRVCATHSPRPLILPATPQTRLASANVSSTPAEERKVFRAPVPRALLLGGRRRRGQRRARTSAVTGRSRGRVPHIPCTLGLIVTEVIANNSLDASEEGALDITFPFSSPWPVGGASFGGGGV